MTPKYTPEEKAAILAYIRDKYDNGNTAAKLPDHIEAKRKYLTDYSDPARRREAAKKQKRDKKGKFS